MVQIAQVESHQKCATTTTTTSTTTTTTMPVWYYDKKDLRNTLSIRDGLDYESERRYRKEGALFIMKCGQNLGLGHNTVATGVVYFHRFYMFHSFKTFPRYVTACCCLFLAGKVEETPKKCMDIIKTARSELTDLKFKSFGDDPKEEVMTLERILLQTIKFDLQVEHPYNYLLKYAKCLKGDKAKLQKMVQMAWNFVNDSLSTTVCLQWEPEIIAVAMIHLASKLSKFTVNDWDGRRPNHLRWWDSFVADISMEILEDICHQVLDLYQQANQAGAESPPQMPASKASPPSTKRIPNSSPLIKKSPNATTSQSQRPAASNPPPTATVTTATPAVAAVAASAPSNALLPTPSTSSLDNQPIPQLITTNESVHYSYASSYTAMYAQQPPYHNVGPGQMQTAMHPPQVVQNNLYANSNQYSQSGMPPTLQAPNMQQFSQSNPAAAYYQPPPPPTAPRNYYHGPT